ncbi:hypothetical protein OGH69_07275 [Flavobacterium sp. MFBS3-15]|uniref:hypothetical protein n=1 Tax=Flavobacterium sp. MFBS3-15 TaxID=2989816 RepID=UPI0022358913|nr:hypothetical protein [Flavobacterium sp. MFBS3-15]MCW4468756.1 hypothetical protein [Flavobacterium sp. MFBS3-15]
MITKKELKVYIDNMPDEMTIDELIDRLILNDKLKNRIHESDNGETISEHSLKSEIQKMVRGLD